MLSQNLPPISKSHSLAKSNCHFHFWLPLILSLSLGSSTKVWADSDWYQKGLSEESKGYYRAAVVSFTKAIQQKPEHVPSLLKLAQALNKNGETQEAIPYYRKVLSLEPDNPVAGEDLAEILSWNESGHEESQKLLRHLLDINPSSLSARRKLGVISSWAPADWGEAIQQLSYVVDSDPKDLKSCLKLAQVLSWSHKWTTAEKYYRQYLQGCPTDNATRLQLAKILSYQSEHRAEALKEFDTVILAEPHNQPARFARALVLAWNGSFEPSLAELRDLVNQDPLSPVMPVSGERQQLVPLLALRRVLNWSGKTSEAEERYRQYLLLPVAAHDWYALNELAELLSHHPQTLTQSLKLVEQVLKQTPDNLKAQSLYARILIGLKQYKPAIEQLRLLIGQNPKQASLRQDLATALQATGHLDEAEHQLKVASIQSPNNPDIMAALADALLQEGKAEEARVAYTKAIVPTHPQAHLYINLAKALAYLHHPDDALLNLNVALALSSQLDVASVAEEFSGPPQLRPLALTLCKQKLAQDPQDARCLLLLGRIQTWEDSSRKEGIKNLEQYLVLHPEDRFCKRYLAEVLSWDGQRKQAQELYEKLLSETPEDTSLATSKAQVLSWRGKLGQSMHEYKDVLKEDPDNFKALVGLGQCLNWSGDHLKAESVFKRAAKKHPNDPELSLERAFNYQQMGRLDKAQELVSRSLGVQQGNF